MQKVCVYCRKADLDSLNKPFSSTEKTSHNICRECHVYAQSELAFKSGILRPGEIYFCWDKASKKWKKGKVATPAPDELQPNSLPPIVQTIIRNVKEYVECTICQCKYIDGTFTMCWHCMFKDHLNYYKRSIKQ